MRKLKRGDFAFLGLQCNFPAVKWHCYNYCPSSTTPFIFRCYGMLPLVMDFHHTNFDCSIRTTLLSTYYYEWLIVFFHDCQLKSLSLIIKVQSSLLKNFTQLCSSRKGELFTGLWFLSQNFLHFSWTYCSNIFLFFLFFRSQSYTLNNYNFIYFLRWKL